jgi:serine/threonine protein kinase
VPSSTFGKYQILERVASGDTAEIFKARLVGIGGFQRTFAIKRILPHLSSNQDFLDLLVDEAKVAGLLSHANIVQILDFGRIDDHYFIAMEYVAGYDLARVLRKCRAKGITIPLPHALYICSEILKGLDYAHNRQIMRSGRPVPLHIVHRALAPTNILVSLQGEVKLTDFGTAKATMRAVESMLCATRGRFDYLSPEQVASRPVDQRSDLFSTGLLLYEMLVGEHPFRRENDLATLDAIRTARCALPSSVNPDIPYALDAIVQRALELDPRTRHPSASAFKDAIDAFFRDVGFFCTQSTLKVFLAGLFPEGVSEAEPTAPEATPPVRSQPTAIPSGFSEAASRSQGDATLDEPLSDVETEVVRPVLPKPGETGAELLPPPVGRAQEPPAQTTVPPPPHSSFRAQLAYLSVSAVTLVIGLVAGYLAGSSSDDSNPDENGPIAATPKEEPLLEIRLPKDAVLTVDKREYTGTSPLVVKLTPQQVHEVSVSLPDAAPIEFPVILDYNQHWIYNIELRTLEPQKKK